MYYLTVPYLALPDREYDIYHCSFTVTVKVFFSFICSKDICYEYDQSGMLCKYLDKSRNCIHKLCKHCFSVTASSVLVTYSCFSLLSISKFEFCCSCEFCSSVNTHWSAVNVCFLNIQHDKMELSERSAQIGLSKFMWCGSLYVQCLSADSGCLWLCTLKTLPWNFSGLLKFKQLDFNTALMYRDHVNTRFCC